MLYLSLTPGEERTVTIEAATNAFGSDAPQILIDGYNVDVKAMDGAVRWLERQCAADALAGYEHRPGGGSTGGGCGFVSVEKAAVGEMCGDLDGATIPRQRHCRYFDGSL